MNAFTPDIVPIVHVIQLAVAPVFLLSGVGIILTVLTNRLARVVDRARQLEAQARTATTADVERHRENLRVLARRARSMNRAITMSTVCALLVSLVVVTLFLSAFFKFDMSIPIALMFIMAMLSLIAALLFFLREVFMAIAALRIGIEHH